MSNAFPSKDTALITGPSRGIGAVWATPCQCLDTGELALA